MDAYDCVATKLDVREFSSKNVPAEIKLKVLEAGRLTGSGINVQHWRFILVQERAALKRLADDSTTGKWVEGADFAIIVLTDPKYPFHLIDAGRAIQNMQTAAWNFGVISCIFTGTNKNAMQKDFGTPNGTDVAVVVGFGYPAKKIIGKRKNRKPFSEIAFLEKYGNRFNPQTLGT